jgi:hypothetical protein
MREGRLTADELLSEYCGLLYRRLGSYAAVARAHRAGSPHVAQVRARREGKGVVKGLSKKTVLVTGGGGAIGSAICRRFHEAGANVLVADRDRNSAERTAAELKMQGLSSSILRTMQARRRFCEHEKIDVLVNNAGWDRFQNFLDTNPRGLGSALRRQSARAAQHAPSRRAAAWPRAGGAGLSTSPPTLRASALPASRSTRRARAGSSRSRRRSRASSRDRASR